MRRLLLISAATLLLAGCDEPKTRAVCPAGKLCLHAANQIEPATLDPIKSTTVPEDNILADLFMGLVTDDVAGKPIPGAATSWTVSPDGLTWTFKLRPAVWSDGVPVTSDDVVAGFRHLVDPNTAAEYAYFGYIIKNGEAVNGGKAPPESLGVTAIDPQTVQIALVHPVPYLPQILKHASTYPLPAHVLKKWGDAWSRPEHLVSNGPYTLASWSWATGAPGENPRFYDAANVCLDEVDYYPITDPTSAERQVRRGELDMANSLRSSRVAYLRQADQIPAYVHTYTYLGIEYLTLNSHVAAFHDKRVRLALDMALDREFYTGKLLRAGELPAYGFVPPGVANYPGGVKAFFADWPLAKRQAEARRLLAEAGYGPGHPLKFELLYPSAGSEVLMPAIQADFRLVGVEATLTQAEGQVQFAMMSARNYQAGLAGWIADYNDANTFLYLLKSSTGQQNYGDYNNPAYDALLDKADREADVKRRAQYLLAAEKAMVDDGAALPIYFWVSRNLANPNITGWVDNIVDHHRKRWMCFKDAAARRAGG